MLGKRNFASLPLRKCSVRAGGSAAGKSEAAPQRSSSCGQPTERAALVFALGVGTRYLSVEVVKGPKKGAEPKRQRETAMHIHTPPLTLPSTVHRQGAAPGTKSGPGKLAAAASAVATKQLWTTRGVEEWPVHAGTREPRARASEPPARQVKPLAGGRLAARFKSGWPRDYPPARHLRFLGTRRRRWRLGSSSPRHRRHRAPRCAWSNPAPPQRP